MNLLSYFDPWADRLEKRMPWFLQYDYVGDPISWVVSHPFFTGCGMLLGALIGQAILFGWVMVCWYALRELFDARRLYKVEGWAGAIRRKHRNPYCKGVQVGWLVDGVGDVVGPACLVLLVSWLT